MLTVFGSTRTGAARSAPEPVTLLARWLLHVKAAVTETVPEEGRSQWTR